VSACVDFSITDLLAHFSSSGGRRRIANCRRPGGHRANSNTFGELFGPKGDLGLELCQGLGSADKSKAF